MPEPTQEVADLDLASEASLPFDLASAETVAFDDVLRLRQAVYATESNRRHFANLLEKVEGAATGSASEKAWRWGAGLFVSGRYAEAAEALRRVRNNLDASHLLG